MIKKALFATVLTTLALNATATEHALDSSALRMIEATLNHELSEQYGVTGVIAYDKESGTTGRYVCETTVFQNDAVRCSSATIETPAVHTAVASL